MLLLCGEDYEKVLQFFHQPHGDIYSSLLAESTGERIPAHSPPHMDTLYYWLSHSKPLTYTS